MVATRILTALVLLFASAPSLRAAPPNANDAPSKTDPTVAALTEQVRQLTDEVRGLRSSVSMLERALREAHIATRPRTYSSTHEELLERARECEVAWDMPSLDGKTELKQDTARTLAFNEAERLAVNGIFQLDAQALITTLRLAYTEVFGHAPTGERSPSDMKDEIKERASRPELQRIFKLLSAERAGLSKAPHPGSEASALERLFREMVTAGDRVEQRIADRVGRDRARRYREFDQGWPNIYVMSWGCPTSPSN